MLSIQVHLHEDELRAARRRAMERSIAWLVADCCWRLPYCKHPAQRPVVALRVAAVNLRRIAALASYSWGRDLGTGLTGLGPSRLACTWHDRLPRLQGPIIELLFGNQPVWIGKASAGS